MDFGLYEKLLDKELINQISELHNETRKVDKSESAKVLATAYYKILRKILSEKKEEEKIDFVRKMNKEIGNEIIFEEDKNFLELLAIHEDENILKQLINDRPKTSISSTTLFTGYTGPALESELRREIRTADRIDFIVSFIKYSGLILIYDDLKEFTKNKKLRIITTSYMGASDYKAILKLSQLPNTEVKISYDTNRTRLHAKAYYFERNTGFSTAYIGSSNISNPALSKGLEWNLKVSEYTSKDVVDSIIKTFETYWNDDEFRTFLPGDEADNKELKIALSRKEKDEDRGYVFFDLKPFSHQKEILEDLRVEREEYGSYKNLVVAATGSGKTRTAISIVDVLMSRGWIKNALFLADRTALVKQAKKNFKNLLPDLSLCNLLDSKDNPESRMVFSTYPTMMNAIDDVKNQYGKKLYTRGHFDLIIIDESHRSIYKKYQAIFNYFDAILLGLTATPRSDIDKNTYEIFELEDNVPTFAYELGEAIEDKFLVPYHTIETTMKFMEKGIHYDDLTEEEKEAFEETFEDGVREISGSELNSFLFNSNTVDIVLKDLMEKGLKVEGGDKLGKTIIFAKNKKHADFIVERFNILYPEYNGEFARPIYTGIKYVDSTMEDFETKERLPQIAVSVDMLDTGIDIPEILNLVFFKKVRSRVKFWQMIGRGTRLCENLFGAGLDKEEFRIFDYCGNFEFFRAEKNRKESKVVKSLTEKIFNIRLGIIKELQNLDYQRDDYENYRKDLVKDVLREVLKIDENKFNARMKLKYLHKFKLETTYENLTDEGLRELEEYIAPLIPSLDEDEMTKRFDFLMYTIEYAELKGLESSRPKNRVIITAEKLSEKGTIEKIKRQEELILKVQTQEFWDQADLLDYEIVRKAFRDLIRLIEEKSKKTYYTNFTDEILTTNENPGEYNVNNMDNYKKKVNKYLKENQDDIVVYKLRNNKGLGEEDIKHLEKILWQDLGTKEDYKKEFGDEPLLKLVSRLVGLDSKAANEVFSDFLSNENLTVSQMEFVKLIVNHIIKNGSLDIKVLNEHPFNKSGNVVKLFDGKINIAKRIISVIDRINSRLSI